MQCDVTDLQGNHCPEEAVHTVVINGVETNLCERCHANVLAGAYGRHLTKRAGDGATCPRCQGKLNQEGYCLACGYPFPPRA